MNPIQYFKNDESGVSPVIGVILMVAITVILAAVIATFVLGLGEQISDTAPQASFTYNYDSGASQLTITHNGGATVEAANIDVKAGGTIVTDSSSPSFNSGGWPTDISAGDSVTISTVSQSDTVQVIWNSPDGDQTAILSEW